MSNDDFIEKLFRELSEAQLAVERDLLQKAYDKNPQVMTFKCKQHVRESNCKECKAKYRCSILAIAEQRFKTTEQIQQN